MLPSGVVTIAAILSAAKSKNGVEISCTCKARIEAFEDSIPAWLDVDHTNINSTPYRPFGSQKVWHARQDNHIAAA